MSELDEISKDRLQKFGLARTNDGQQCVQRKDSTPTQAGKGNEPVVHLSWGSIQEFAQ